MPNDRDLTLYEAMIDEDAAELITTVENEFIFLLRNDRAVDRLISEYLGLKLEGHRWFCPEGKLVEKIRQARDEAGSAPIDLSGYEGDDQLHFHDLVKLLFDAKDVGWDDSYELCEDCGLWVYTQPTSYIDAGRFSRSPDGDITCRACCEKNPERHLMEYLEHDGKMAFILDPSTLDFEQVNEDPFQNGLHHGMADDPKAQRKLLRKAGISEVIMTVEPSQFYVEWETWVRPEHVGPARALLVHHGELWHNERNASLVVCHIGGEVMAYYRISDYAPWEASTWSYEDEERWYKLWKTRSEEVYEFDYLTEETWNHRHCIALCRLKHYDPTEVWTRVPASLRQSPTPAQRMESALKGLTP